MQFARAPIIVQAIGYVAVLLDFDQAAPCSDCVHCVGGDIEEIAWDDIEPGHSRFDRAVESGRFERFGVERFLETDTDPRTRFASGDQPTLFLAFAPAGRSQSLSVVGMDLDGQIFAGE